MPNVRRLGAEVEDLVADYLLGQGYTIVTRRYKARHGEIDIVALDEEELVFVEVRSRSHAVPEESIGEAKMEHVRRAAAEYVLVMEQQHRNVRFDVVAVTPTEMRHHKRVFVD